MASKRDQSRLFLLEHMPKNGICAEIGVWCGDFSELILEYTKPAELHLIDPWLFSPQYPRRLYGGLSAKSQEEMDQICTSVARRFCEAEQVRMHRKASTEASRAFPDGYFDWIYIDGNHSYDAVLSDLEHWVRKVRSGGFVTGDDFHWLDEKNSRPVKAAVFAFLRNRTTPEFIMRNDQFMIRV